MTRKAQNVGGTSDTPTATRHTAKLFHHYRWYTAVVLMAVYAVQTIDRSVLSILLPPIKAEFRLSDTQAGILYSATYAVPYVLAGIAFGLLIDRVNRRNLIAGAIAAWSALTALSGVASSYAMLALARIGVGVGEAPCHPASMSILSDLFHRRERAKAVGVLVMGLGIGQLVGLTVGGAAAAHFGWRGAFFVAGLPGLVLSLILVLTVREPRHGAADGRVVLDEAPSAINTLRFILSQRSLRLLFPCPIIYSLAASATFAFLPSFFIRSHGLSIREAGMVVGLAYGGSSIAGSLASGVIADWLGRRDVRWIPYFTATISAMALVSAAAAVTVGSTPLSIAAIAIYGATITCQSVPSLALLQGLVQPRMRGAATALQNVLVQLIGNGAGAALTGFLSDQYAPWSGGDALRWALLTVSVINVAPIMLYAGMTRTLKRDLARIA